MKSQSLTNTDYRTLLKQTLLERTKKNSAYSLRSFSKSLGVNHAHLSLVLRGKRAITPKLVRKTGTQLGLAPHQINHYIKLLPNEFKSIQFTAENAGLDFIETQQFETISNWHHDAILELIRLQDFKNDIRWIAKRLGINHVQAQDAFDRLLQIGLITVNEDGEVLQDFVDTTTNITNDTTSSALRKYQADILDKSKAALQELPRTVRDHSSMTLAFDISNIDLAKKLISEFRIKFMRQMQSKPADFDQVYQLSISFFPLTNTNTKTKKLTNKPKKETL